jgi:heme-degrading monooxygenase HmoA
MSSHEPADRHLLNLARTPAPPYYAVVFASVSESLTAEAALEYAGVAARMVELAATMTGFLGMDSVRGADGVGITVSYWESEADIQAWKANAEHTLARERGRADWYAAYTLRVARVERAYGFERR